MIKLIEIWLNISLILVGTLSTLMPAAIAIALSLFLNNWLFMLVLLFYIFFTPLYILMWDDIVHEIKYDTKGY